MGAQAVVWAVTIGVLAAQVGPWRAPVSAAAMAAGVAAVGWRATGLAGVGWVAIGSLAATLSTLRSRTVDRPALEPDHVARLPLPHRTRVQADVEALHRGPRGRVVLVLRATAVDRQGAWRPARGRIRLSVRGRLPKLRTGDALRLETTLRAPRNFANPGSFDFVGHLARRGIRVTAAVWEGGAIERLPRRTRGAAMRLARWRERLARAIHRAVPAPRAAVLEALVLGADDRITASLRDAFARAGVVHVLSVSGLHIAMVGAAGYAVVRWLLARSERLLLTLDVRRTAALISLAPVAGYAALAGFEIATVRSLVMAGVGVTALLLDRRADMVRILALAATGITLAQPGAPREIGFQLSFVSVLALVLGVRRWAPGVAAGAGARLRAALVVAAAALVGTAPLTALHFQQVSPMGLLANPLVVPLFGSVVVGLGLIGAAVEPVSPPGAAALFWVAGEALRPGLWLVEALAAPAWSAVAVPRPNPIEVALLFTAMLGVMVRGTLGRRLAIAAAAGLLVDVGYWVHVRWWPGVLRVTFLDVGQGDAAVAELPDGRVLVVDAGGFPGSDFDTGTAVVAPYLATRKIARIDALAMSHAHPDHASGLASLVRRYRPVEFWWTGHGGRGAAWERLVAALGATGTPGRILAPAAPPAGWEDAVSVLHPPADWPVAGLNDSSLALRLASGAGGVLLAGDVEGIAEAHMLAARTALPSWVLKVPHHGSRTSSTGGFVDAVAPRVAVVSVGADNRYRLPAPEVEARYRERGVCLLRTDRCGAVTVVLDGRRLAVTTTRPGCACATAAPAAPLRPPP